MVVHQNYAEPWRVTLVDTGDNSMSGGRLKRVQPFIGDETFCFTYGDSTWINGGFFVLEPEVFNFIKDDETAWEREPLENLAREEQLAAYKHHGFWRHYGYAP